MPINQLNFQGINRAISDYSAAGACEELINLRPTTGGLVPVKEFGVKRWNSTFSKVYVHHAAGVTNYIGLQIGSGYLDLILLGVTASGDTQIGRITVSSSYTHFSSDQVSFASTGNIILVSIKDDEDKFFVNKSYLLTETGYQEITSDVPTISASFSAGTPVVRSHEGVKIFQDDVTIEQVGQYMADGMNAIVSANKDLCFGPILIAIAFKTKNGDTFWTNQWFFYDPIPVLKNSDIFIPYADLPADLQPYLPNGGFMFYIEGLDIHHHGDAHEYLACGSQITMTISPLPSSAWEQDKSMIRSVEIYTSRPAFYLDENISSTSLIPNVGTYDDIIGAELMLAQRDVRNMELDNQILFLQKSIPMNEIVGASNSYTFTFEFGGALQTTNKTLDVDAGAVTRYGKMLSYNARFHFYDSVAKTEIGGVQFYFDGSSSSRTTDVFVRFHDDQQDKLLYLGSQTMPYAGWGAYVVLSTSLKIKEVITRDSQGYAHRYEMTESQRYNYSICVQGHSSVGYFNTSEMIAAKAAGVTNFAYTEEPAAINVTEQYSPFVFLVEHSYLAPGKILDIQPQLFADADISFGMYPLNVFTSRGLYALNQGSASVLYGDFDALSNLITESNSISTELGTFFLAEGALWLIAGRHTTLISDALHLGPHMEIRNCTGFQSLISNEKYAIGGYLSSTEFIFFAAGAVLCYNRHRDEIYISNSHYSYSYALSLKYRQWFKITTKIWQNTIGGDIAITPGTTSGINIVDLENELGPRVIFQLQSRPFSVGYSYSHIHRVVAMIKASISTDEMIIVSLYGSDDLKNWTLLSYAARTSTSTATPPAKLDVSQIRTASAARSWRYYTVCVGGTTPTTADFGPVLYDYQSVVRRFG